MHAYHLGINLSHDRSAAIVRDGQIIVAIQQERLDRNRYSLGYLHQAVGDDAQIQIPDEAIRYCLDSCGVRLEDVATITANMPGIDHAPAILRRSLPRDQADKVAVIPSHHLAHAYAAYWPSAFEAAVVLTVDASGSTSAEGRTESYTIFEARGENLRAIHSEDVSAHLAELSTLGFVYEFITRKAGFVTAAGPALSVPEAGKLMGLAPYGGEQANWHRWFQCGEGSYRIGISAYDILLEVAALEKRYDDGQGAPYLRPYLVDLAFKVQNELEEALLHLVALAVRQTGLKKVCLGGGVALNSVANYRILRELDLEDVFIFPAAGDAGIAAGCALFAYAKLEGGQRRAPLRTAALGRRYGDAELCQALEEFEDRIEVTRLSPGAMIEESARALVGGHVVARYEGRSEFGPRALGHRSILADPTFERMKDILNARVKFREAFRPFAPVIAEEHIAEVFEHEAASPFMLLVAPVKTAYHKVIPSVTHEDGTGRVQTVTAEHNPYLYSMCSKVAALRSGPPVVLNTSFNVAGQPIVETPREAIATYLSTDIDYLALEEFWVTKRGVRVAGCAEIVAELPPIPLPRGLPAGQPAATDLMRKLDRALFFGDTEGCPWTTEELSALSAEIGRYKETSVLFPESPFGRPFRTELSKGVVLILNPLGQSRLIDTAGGALPSSWAFEEVKLLFSALEGDAEGRETLRTELELTHRALAHRLEQTEDRLRAYGIEKGARDLGGEDDTAVHEASTTTLAPFADERFSQKNVLGRLCDRLERAGYTEEGICALLGIASLQRIEPTHLGYYDRFRLPASDLADLIRLFLLQRALPRERVAALLGEDALNALAALCVLSPRGEAWASRIDLFCVEDLLIATDHRYRLFDDGLLPEEDTVMYVGLDSRGLVHTAPRGPARRALDLCTGAGVQALSAARYAREVIGVDVNPRAIRFARFNAELNGVPNVRFLLGDLYEAVPDQRFDVILANPPFVASPRADVRFRDGGRSGEDVLCRIIAGAPSALTPEGRLYVVSDLADVQDYEAKLARWWRGAAAHFLLLHTADRDDLLFSIPHSHAPFGQSFEAYDAELTRWVKNFRAAGLSAVNFGYILARRLPGGVGGSFCRRTIHNPDRPIYGHVDAYFEQRRLLSSPRAIDHVLKLSPSLHYRIEFTPEGAERRIQLYSPDDPYFTTYDIDEALFQTLRGIERQRPSLRVAIAGGTRDEILDLLYRGILELKAPSPGGRALLEERDLAPRAASGVGMHQRPPPPHGFAIREIATRTTPTCLSSYLRQ
jgi:carbamoyltransferase